MYLDELKHRIYTSLIMLGILLPIFTFIFLVYFLISSFAKAEIVLDASQVQGPAIPSYTNLAQGGEGLGSDLLRQVTPQLQALAPRYIRIDHTYDFYDVVRRSPNGYVVYNWNKLDVTVCDIYKVGARPFFSLGYMPKAISSTGSIVDTPKSWAEWSDLVQKTVEHYSGLSSSLCNGQVQAEKLSNIYYEVWNEPDLEAFGKWSLYEDTRSYLTLYSYSALAAQAAQNVYPFYIGGPATTALYQNWVKRFVDYAQQNNLRLDFISWHRYSENIDVFEKDLDNIRAWLPENEYPRYYNIPVVISEWGLDSDVNPVTDTKIGAAHMVAADSLFTEKNVDLAFLFEIKDGPTLSHGLLKTNNETTPRYDALKLIKDLTGYRLALTGQSNYIRGMAVKTTGKVTLVLSNYDIQNQHGELVPVTLTNLDPGHYSVLVTRLGIDTPIVATPFDITQGMTTKQSFFLNPNDVIKIEFIRQ